MSADPRTDPQSTVPVEPHGACMGRCHSDYMAGRLVPLDAARASQPITATACHHTNLANDGRFCLNCRSALPVREDEPTGIDGALKTIRDLCDMDLEEQRAEFGSEQRVMHVVIPAVVNDALGVEPMSEGLRRVLFRLFSYIGEASHVR